MIYKKEEIHTLFQEMSSVFDNAPITITLPPPSFVTMNAVMEEYEKNKRLIVSFPVDMSQTNPVGVMQGGFIAAAFDNTFGPLSYMVAKRPMTTIDMSIQYIRGVEVNQTVLVEAKIVAKGFSTLHMTAEMRNQKGKILATASTNLLIIKMPG
ncbi:MAG: PaaI family thioesterase [Leptospira sp.]|nr:PaaI family thioesterase [Leptospira sp.]